MKMQKTTFQFFHVRSCTNTQESALALSKEYQQAVVLLTDTQTQGRGRRGREWLSSDHSLTMSATLARPNNPKDLSLLSLCAGVALYLTLEEMCEEDLGLTLKWPNDLGIYRTVEKGHEFSKLAGVLVETKEEWIVIGWGLNLRTEKNGNAIFPGALCLSEVNKKPFAKKELARRLAACFYQMTSKLSEPATHDSFLEFVHNKAMRALWTKELGKNWQGHTAHGIAGDGALITRNGTEVQSIYSGEI